MEEKYKKIDIKKKSTQTIFHTIFNNIFNGKDNESRTKNRIKRNHFYFGKRFVFIHMAFNC